MIRIRSCRTLPVTLCGGFGVHLHGAVWFVFVCALVSLCFVELKRFCQRNQLDSARLFILGDN